MKKKAQSRNATRTTSHRNNGSNSGSIYIIHAVGTKHYKIGKTSRTPQDRLQSLQTGNPYRLRLLHHVPTDRMDELELEMHERYKAYRLDGEWFNLDDIESVIAFLNEKSSEHIPYQSTCVKSDVEYAADTIARALRDLSEDLGYLFHDVIDTRLERIERSISSLADAVADVNKPPKDIVFYMPDGTPLTRWELTCYADRLTDGEFVIWDMDNDEEIEWPE